MWGVVWGRPGNDFDYCTGIMMMMMICFVGTCIAGTYFVIDSKDYFACVLLF